MLNIYRVVVRGEFAGLTDEQRDELTAEAPEHDIFRSSYTAAGTFTYEPRLHAFSFRYEVRERGDDGRPEAECRDAALATADGLARAYLGARDIGHKRLRATATNMADMWSDRDTGAG